MKNRSVGGRERSKTAPVTIGARHGMWPTRAIIVVLVAGALSVSCSSSSHTARRRATPTTTHPVTRSAGVIQPSATAQVSLPAPGKYVVVTGFVTSVASSESKVCISLLMHDNAHQRCAGVTLPNPHGGSGPYDFTPLTEPCSPVHVGERVRVALARVNDRLTWVLC